MLRNSVGRIAATIGLVILIGVGTPLSASAEAPSVEADQFSKDIKVIGPEEYENPFAGTYRSWRIRTWIDKATGATQNQLYVEIHYFGDWRFYQEAATDQAQQLNVVDIDRHVEDCHGICTLDEVVGIDLDAALLRTRVSTGMQVKLSAKSGDSLILGITSQQISQQLAVIDRYSHGTGGAPGAVASAPTFPSAQKGRLGVQYIPLPPAAAAKLNLKPGTGMFVMTVQDNSPAALAGIQKFDIIISLNNQPIASAADVTRVIDGAPAGSPVKVHIWRSGQELDLQLRP